MLGCNNSLPDVVHIRQLYVLQKVGERSVLRTTDDAVVVLPRADCVRFGVVKGRKVFSASVAVLAVQLVNHVSAMRVVVLEPSRRELACVHRHLAGVVTAVGVSASNHIHHIADDITVRAVELGFVLDQKTRFPDKPGNASANRRRRRRSARNSVQQRGSVRDPLKFKVLGTLNDLCVQPKRPSGVLHLDHPEYVAVTWTGHVTDGDPSDVRVRDTSMLIELSSKLVHVGGSRHDTGAAAVRASGSPRLDAVVVHAGNHWYRNRFVVDQHQISVVVVLGVGVVKAREGFGAANERHGWSVGW